MRLAALLGPLAPWWLADDVLQVLARELPEHFDPPASRRPELPSEAGSCSAILANSDPGCRPRLRRAFLLPLRWGRGEGDDLALPPDLLRVADDVRRHTNLSGWGLRLSSALGPDGMDLREVDFTFDSAWVALAGGLITDAEGGSTRPWVWATGTWAEGGGIGDVDHLEAKLALARDWPVEEVYLPERQAAAAPAGRYTVGALRQGPRDWRQAMGEYLASLDVVPPVPEPGDEPAFQACVRYYLRRPDHAEGINRFYRTHLLRRVADHCRRQVRSACQPTHLVTVVSTSPELAALSAATFGAPNRLLLHTSDDKQKEAAHTIKKFLDEDLKLAGTTEPASFSKGPDMAQQMIDLGNQFLLGVPAGKVVIDLKPGNKKMTYALSRLARRGDWLFDFEGERRGYRRTVPLTETVDLWQAAG
jgi:hypothetical protein